MSTSQVHRTGYAERPKEYFVETTVLQRHLGEIVSFNGKKATNLNDPKRWDRAAQNLFPPYSGT